MVVDGKMEPIMAVHVDGSVIAGSDEACRYFHAALNTEFPTNTVGKPTWYNDCVNLGNWEFDTLTIAQKTFIEGMPNRFDVNSSLDIPATSGVELGPREEGDQRETGRTGML